MSNCLAQLGLWTMERLPGAIILIMDMQDIISIFAQIPRCILLSVVTMTPCTLPSPATASTPPLVTASGRQPFELSHATSLAT